MTRRERAAIIRNPPPGWGRLFAPVPSTGNRPSGKVRCLLCGRHGYGYAGQAEKPWCDPAPWQAPCIAGHPERCGTCRRPFTGRGALAGHQSCKLHHACCLSHTTVPEWANPYRHTLDKGVE